MLDCRFWCGLTMKPVGKGFLANCPNFELGSGKLYEPVPQGIIPKQKIQKVARKEIKSKEIKLKAPIKSSKKIKPETPRLF